MEFRKIDNSLVINHFPLSFNRIYTIICNYLYKIFKINFVENLHNDFEKKKFECKKKEFDKIATKLLKKHKIINIDFFNKNFVTFYNDLYHKWNDKLKKLMDVDKKIFIIFLEIEKSLYYSYNNEYINKIKTNYDFFKYLFKNMYSDKLNQLAKKYYSEECFCKTFNPNEDNMLLINTFLSIFFNASVKNIIYLYKKGYPQKDNYLINHFYDIEKMEFMSLLNTGINLTNLNLNIINLLNNKKFKEKFLKMDKILFEKIMFLFDYSFFKKEEIELLNKIISKKLKRKSRKLLDFIKKNN